MENSDKNKPKEPVTDTDVGIKPKELEWEKWDSKKRFFEFKSIEDRDMCLEWINQLLTQQRTELNREWNSKLLLSQREMIYSFKNKEQGVKNWEDEYFRRYQDGLWSDADSLAVDKSSEVKEFIKETVMDVRTELLEEIKKLKKDEFHCCGFNDDGKSNCPSFCTGVEYNKAIKDIIYLLNKKDE